METKISKHAMTMAGASRTSTSVRGRMLAAWALLAAVPLAAYAGGVGTEQVLAAAATVTGQGTAKYVPIWTGSTTLGNSRIYDNGNVGIGTTAPLAALQVAKDVSISGGYGQIEAVGATNKAKRTTLGFDTSSNFGWIQPSETGVGYRNLALVPKGGYVGIGTASPTQLLTLSTVYPVVKFEESGVTANNKNWYFEANSEVFKGRILNDAENVGSDWLRVDRTGTTVDYVSFPNGNVGIGTTEPQTNLQIEGSTVAQLQMHHSGGPTLYVTTSEGAGMAGMHSNLGLDIQANGNVLLSRQAGNVGIGTTTPTQRLQVVGNVTADDYLFNSDARLKADIAPLENAGKGIVCLEGVTYRWSDPNEPQDLQVGLIAQDVERCFPELVTTAPDGYKSVSYARLVAPLIENAKEQQREITRLKAEQATTTARLARIEALLAGRR